MGIVYRVENAAEMGPYNGSFSQKDRMSSAHWGSSHPTPWSDNSLRGISMNEFCGFDSRENLRKWFLGFMRALNADGFKISVYYCPDSEMRTGKKGQVVFRKHEATKVAEHNLLSKIPA